MEARVCGGFLSSGERDRHWAAGRRGPWAGFTPHPRRRWKHPPLRGNASSARHARRVAVRRWLASRCRIDGVEKCPSDTPSPGGAEYGASGKKVVCVRVLCRGSPFRGPGGVTPHLIVVTPRSATSALVVVVVRGLRRRVKRRGSVLRRRCRVKRSRYPLERAARWRADRLTFVGGVLGDVAPPKYLGDVAEVWCCARLHHPVSTFTGRVPMPWRSWRISACGSVAM